MQPGFISEPCYNLLYLELAACRLTSLPAELARLVPNVRVLNLNYNFLDDLRGLEGLTRLRKLTIIGSRIKATKQLVRMLKGMRDVEILDFRYVDLMFSSLFPVLSSSSSRSWPFPEDHSTCATGPRSSRPDYRPMRFATPHRAGFASATTCGSRRLRSGPAQDHLLPFLVPSRPGPLTNFATAAERVLMECATRAQGLRCRWWPRAMEDVHQSVRHPASIALPAARVRSPHFHLSLTRLPALACAFAHADHAVAEPP